MSAAPKFKNHVKISERHGAGEWKIEKLALLALMPLGLWVLSSALTLAGAGYEAVVAWFGNALNMGLLAVTAIVFFLFASLAWKVIIEDYVPTPSARTTLINLSNLVFLVLAAASIFFIVRVAMGSAPLPAGV
ncbi:succinate dehydrogenase / fumarate reductase membrane anchor subunit [Brevundimonas bullata]|uniref:Succinate dehydrogenase / fumarate reductase membrane anchor subunit n=1 Tax=Brevundimonas bullata TaxID=13160 RepID=A0A7W7IMJ7_9CAUL|nr:succinate dehydrogenase [Brevundimonas bullata]MBB4796932.1 succinate dehydrogenase / fumarate reductase membrane anchor subunit [Brevundimonas bullata]MBB6381891.1 succinate dehydrogenase / fumarate reductase membrane anchor subunit [Brevundimonas bullata]